MSIIILIYLRIEWRSKAKQLTNEQYNHIFKYGLATGKTFKEARRAIEDVNKAFNTDDYFYKL